MLDVNTVAKYMLLFVVQQDAQNLIINYMLDQFSGAAQEFFDVKNGADFPADFVENQKRFGLCADLLKKTRIFDGYGQTDGKQAENFLLFLGEVAGVLALDIQHANAFTSKHQGNGELGADAFNGVDIARI